MRIERHVVFWLFSAIALFAAIAILREVLLPFVAGMVIAYFLNPVADRLQAAGLSRTSAAALIILVGGVVLVSLIIFLVPLLSNQLRQLALSMPDDIDRAKKALDAWLEVRLGDRFPFVKGSIDRGLAELSLNWSSLIASMVSALWKQGVALLNVLSVLLVTPIVVFYLLVDWHPMVDRVDGWLPREHASTIRRLSSEINQAIAAFFRGQGLICIILGILYAITLSLAGVRYGVLIGLATGALAFVPYIGWMLGFLAAIAITLIHAPQDLVAIGKVAGIFGAGMALDSAVLSPRIVGAKVGLHPVWLMFALFAFSYLFGFVGMLVAVPVAAGVAVLARFAIERYLESDIYRGKQPGAIPGRADTESRTQQL